jgi:hypothetical protein
VTRRRKLVLVAACGLAAVVAVCIFALREAEPSYNGRTLSEWLERRDGNARMDALYAESQRREAEVAVREIGTNAVPTLVQWCAGMDAPVVEFLGHHSRIPGAARTVDRVYGNMQRGFWGFIILGTNALPTLRSMASNPEVRIRIAVSNAMDVISNYNSPSYDKTMY